MKGVGIGLPKYVNFHVANSIAGIRVRIEHAIGSVKRYRIVKDKSRNWKPGFRDLVVDICCGLHNFRLNFRPWHYKPITYLNCLLNS